MKYMKKAGGHPKKSIENVFLMYFMISCFPVKRPSTNQGAFG